MREIKFRGKRLDNGEWVYGSLLHGENIIYPSGKAFPIDPKTVGEFTGLYDKSKKPIYEGDIVRQTNNNEMYGIIEYKAPKFYCKELSHYRKIESESTFYTVEVIGNIHENPELLKEGQ